MAKSKLSTDAKNYWVNGTNTVIVTYPDHGKEKLTVKFKSKGVAEANIGKWFGDKCSIEVTALKNTNTTMTITVGTESVKVKLYLKNAEEQSGEDIFDELLKATVEIRSTDRTGSVYTSSGFFADDGVIVTNYHNIEAASKIEISDHEGNKYSIDIVLCADPAKDIIAFKVGKTPYALTPVGQTDNGSVIYSMGSPGGISFSFARGTLSNGSYDTGEGVYALAFIPTGIGSGGSPVVNAKGQLVGMITLTVNDSQEMVFCITAEDIVEFLSQITKNDHMTLEDLYQSTANNRKKSNSYDIFDDFVTKGTTKTSKALASDELYDLAAHATVDIITKSASGREIEAGSGFFVDEDTIITNEHVVSSRTIEACLYETLDIFDYAGNRYAAYSIERDRVHDVAVIKVKSAAQHGVLSVDKDYIPSGGEEVYVMGSPLGLSCVFSTGITIMPIRTVDGVDYINYSAQISAGSSGGPLLNKYGEVVGINSRTINVTELSNLAVTMKYLHSD